MTETRWPRGLSEPLAAEYVGLSVSSLRTLRTAGDFPPAVKLTPGRLVFLRDEVDAWLDHRAGLKPEVKPDATDGSEWMASIEKVRRGQGF